MTGIKKIHAAVFESDAVQVLTTLLHAMLYFVNSAVEPRCIM